MSDFIAAGFDYIDFITTPADMKIFERMKVLEKELRKPLKECLSEVMEFAQCDRKLRGVQPVKFIFQQNPKLN